jgi:hypothetical protein
MPPIRTNTPSQTDTSSANSQPNMTASTTSSARSTNILTSWIWNHGTKIKGSPGQPDRWCCNLCPQTHPATYSVRTTSNAAEPAFLLSMGGLMSGLKGYPLGLMSF